MALQVWLPLNGNLNNLGLSNITVTNNGASVNASGKIGLCYSFDGSDDFISLNGLCLYDIIKGGSLQFSISFWVYHNDSTRAILFGDYSLSGAINFNIELSTSHCVRFYWGASPDTTKSEMNVGLQTWSHIALCYNGTLLKWYHNGILKATDNITLAEKSKTSGVYYLGRDSRTGTTALNGKLNDFRIYNHALSDKEIKEISKGLILHYPLSSGYIEPTTNLIGGPTYLFDTCYNGSTGKYGFGAETDIYQIIGNFNGKQCTKVYMGTDGLSAYPYPHFDQTKSTPAINGYKTISFDYYPTKIESLVFYSHGTSCTFSWKLNNNAIGTTGTISGILIKLWNHIEMTIYNNGTTTGGCGYVRIGISSHTSTTTDYWLFANMLIEEKDHATPYTPGIREVGVVYDSSGIGNNGTVFGNLVVVKESARNSCCTFWKASSAALNRIVSKALTFDGKGFTAAVWVKFTGTTAGGGSYHMPLESSSSGYYEMSISNSGILRAGIYINGTRYVENCSNPSMYDGKWHHIAITYDGAKICRYVDGIAYVQTTVSGTASGTSQAFYLGQYGTSTSYWNNSVYESDARIYATALSAEDIKELYNTPISITNTGCVITLGEFVEE